MCITVNSFKKNFGVHFTIEHNGKMEGMCSLSTSCKDNKICKERSKDSLSICSKCYAQRMMKCFTNMQKPLKKNLDILTSRIIPVDEFPFLNNAYFRLEAFGDLENDIQLINYFNLCNRNKNTRFALWTKNSWIVDNVINSGVKKPSNLNIVLSSPYMNEQIDASNYDWVDTVFTVFDKDYIKENNVKINCGGKKCVDCLKCYKKHKELTYVNEMLKR